MNMFTMGNYYVWYCDWCDSTNQTQWSPIKRHDLTCSACQRPRTDGDAEMYGLLPRTA